MIRKKRSVGVSILLSLITCGLYTLYWIYQLNEDIQYLNPKREYTSSGMVVLFTIVTCGLYIFYWFYKMGEYLEEAQEIRGLRITDNFLLFILIAIMGLGIINLAIIQSNINEFIDYDQITKNPY